MNGARPLSAKKPEEYFKAPGFEGYLTRGEVARKVGRDRKRLTQLEKEHKIPAPIRIKHGKLTIRLYSPEQVGRIQAWFDNNGVPQRGRRHK